MGQTAILFPSGAKQPDSVRAWLARAAQARRIAPMLASRDAEILEAFARECEARAAKPANAKSAIAA
jgi:hypothetical protein